MSATTPQAAILRQRAERVTLLFKECVYRVAGYEQYCVWGWVLVCSRFFKSSHFSLSLLPVFLLAWPCSAAALRSCCVLRAHGLCGLRFPGASLHRRAAVNAALPLQAQRPSRELDGARGLHRPSIQNRPYTHTSPPCREPWL